MMNERNRNRIRILTYCLSAFFLLSFLLFGGFALKMYLQQQGEEKAFRELKDGISVTSEKTDKADSADEPENNIPDPSKDSAYEYPEEIVYTEYLSLYEQNRDFVGWLHIDHTNVDYPVMWTPKEPEYYLRRAFDKTDARSGTPFVSANSSIDSDFYIIYGHNMKNDTMFGTLEKYADKAFWEETPVFTFTTVTEEREYEVFATIETRILNQNEVGYRYYFEVGDLTEESFDQLINWLREHAMYDTGITPAYGEQIVVLSTCSYHEDNGRFLIAARRIDDAE